MVRMPVRRTHRSTRRPYFLMMRLWWRDAEEKIEEIVDLGSFRLGQALLGTYVLKKLEQKIKVPR